MSGRHSDEGELWRGICRLIWPVLLGVAPVFDLSSRYRVRRLALRLVRCDPWPGLEATGEEVAQLAILRLRSLQRATHRAVRSRQTEAATMLARASIEMLITGLYCLYEPGAVAQLQAQNVRNLPLLLRFATSAGVIPANVLAECISRLGYGSPARGPSVEAMAAAVDNALGAPAAVDLYDRFYRPASTFTVHGGAALLRHVDSDDHLARRPGRTWARRTPARVADACLGALVANLSRRIGSPSELAENYVERHLNRALVPMIVMSSPGLGRFVAPGRLWRSITTLRAMYGYAWSGQDMDRPTVRVARIRRDMELFLLSGVSGIPAGSLDPFLDYVAEKIAAETASSAGETSAPTGASQSG